MNLLHLLSFENVLLCCYSDNNNKSQCERTCLLLLISKGVTLAWGGGGDAGAIIEIMIEMIMISSAGTTLCSWLTFMIYLFFFGL